jgi:hypothetical protein
MAWINTINVQLMLRQAVGNQLLEINFQLSAISFQLPAVMFFEVFLADG